MKKKFFNKDIEPRCEYCLNARVFSSEDYMLCKYKVVVYKENKCRKYKYDVLKRTPKVTKLSDDYSSDDFVL